MLDQRSDEAIYGEHSQELVRFASGLVGPDDAPDVVMEAFIRLTTSPAWAEAIDHRALWYRAVTYEAQSWKRSAARRRARESRSDLASITPANMPERDERVLAAMAVLSTQQRAVVMLTYWSDLDVKSAGLLLDVSEGTVRKQLARARRKLREELSSE